MSLEIVNSKYLIIHIDRIVFKLGRAGFSLL